jgi:toxin ParE1/3/4
MMLEIRLTPLARADLDGIWNFTTAQWGMDQAEAYLLGLNTTMAILAGQPGLGRSIDHVRAEYFKFPTASHILIYRLRPGSIEFVRILHKSSDVDQHL